MKIEANGDEKLTVALSHEDMHELDITYDEMDYSNIETRRVIWTILDKARLSLGRSIDPEGRLLIEVSPLDDGGCVLYFTSLPAYDGKTKKRTIMKKDDEPLMFRPLSEDAYIDSLVLLKSKSDELRSYTCYRLDGTLSTVIYPKPTYSSAVSFMLGEFGEVSVCRCSEAARLFEHGEELLFRLSE